MKSRSGSQVQARMPKGMRVYAVGDIHGCDDALRELHGAIAADAASFDGRKQIVYLGDYVDRGPNSRGVIELLLEHVPQGFSARYIKGNHDVAVLDFLKNAKTYRAWRDFGGAETLRSYGVAPPRFDRLEHIKRAQVAFANALPKTHLAFLRGLEAMVLLGDYAFVHAGIKPRRELDKQDEADLLWIRDEFLAFRDPHEKIIVHGHSPMPEPMILSNRISVDTGAYMTGTMSCAVLEEEECRFLQVHVL